MHRIATWFLIAFLLTTAGAFGAEVSWALYDNDCPASRATLRVDAGDYGVFYFGAPPVAACNPLANGIEPLAVYPEPGSPPPVLPCQQGGPGVAGGDDSGGGAGIVAKGPKGAKDGDTDSDPGDGDTAARCATPLVEIQGAWVAVVDWDDWHGNSVSWAIRSATHSAIEPVLLALESVLPDVAGITDVDVLARLAEIAQIVAGGVPPPLAINMSFGRMPLESDPVDRECAAGTLACQISRLLAFLVQPDPNQPPVIAAVAAAGNHRELLFPARLDHVVAAGALDLAGFAVVDTTTYTWETPLIPATPQALMPGSALCLQTGAGGPQTWPVPSGSSFASAITTGWLAEAILFQPSVALPRVLRQPGWEPRRVCNSNHCELFLAHGNEIFWTPSGNAAALVEDALYGDPFSCGASRGLQLTINADMHPDGLFPFEHLSLVRLIAETHQPAPAPDPCVPCALPSPLVDLLTDPSDPARKGQATPVHLEIDLHASWRLPDGIRIEEAFVRIGSEVHWVELAAEDLYHLAQGDVAYLNVSGTLLDPPYLGEQPSLITVLSREVGDDGAREEFWHATPLIWREP